MVFMQGFASGSLERDATAVRIFADAGMELLLSQASKLAACVPTYLVAGGRSPAADTIQRLAMLSAMSLFQCSGSNMHISVIW